MNLQESIERNVLSHLIYAGKSGNTDSVYEAISKVEPDLFTDEKNRMLYSVLVKVVVTHRKMDILHLHAELSVKNTLELVGGHKYLADLTTNRERTTTLEKSIDALINADKRRKVKDSLSIALEEIENTTDVDNVISSLDNKLYHLVSRESDYTVDIRKTVDEVIKKANNSVKYGCYGFSWGIPSLDMLTSGIELGKTYVIGSTKKSGKSKIVVNTIKALVEAKVKSLFLSLEMGGESVVKELISAFADINNNLLKMPLDIDVENKIREVTEKFENVEIDTQSYLTIMQIRHKVRQASQRGVKVVFIDYLQRMNFEKRSNSNDAKIIADTCSQIADIAKEFNVAIIYLSQLRNDADNEMADISMLKDSGGIAEAVDCILIINNIDRIEKNYDEYSKKNEAHIMVEQRSGVSGVVICDIDLSRAKFSEKEKRF